VVKKKGMKLQNYIVEPWAEVRNEWISMFIFMFWGYIQCMLHDPSSVPYTASRGRKLAVRHHIAVII